MSRRRGLAVAAVVALAVVAGWGAVRLATRAAAAAAGAVLEERSEAIRAGDCAAFLRTADARRAAWRRFQQVVCEQRLEPPTPGEVASITRIGGLWRVRAAGAGGERTYVLRRTGGAWVTTEPTEAELGARAHRDVGIFRIYYYPRWEPSETVDLVAAVAVDVAATLTLHMAVSPQRVQIFLHHRAADRQELGWDVITRRGASRAREVHLWSPHSYGWGLRPAPSAVADDLRQALGIELLFILPGF